MAINFAPKWLDVFVRNYGSCAQRSCKFVLKFTLLQSQPVVSFLSVCTFPWEILLPFCSLGKCHLFFGQDAYQICIEFLHIEHNVSAYCTVTAVSLLLTQIWHFLIIGNVLVKSYTDVALWPEKSTCTSNCATTHCQYTLQFIVDPGLVLLDYWQCPDHFMHCSSFSDNWK